MNLGERHVMGAYREPHSRKMLSLTYLCEDLELRLAKLNDWNNERELNPRDIDKACLIVRQLGQMDLGFLGELNRLQFLFGDMQEELWEGSPEYELLDQSIELIQDFIDW
jgi:hypothetical protein